MLSDSKPPDSGGFSVGWVVWRCGAWKVASSNERMLAGGGCIVGRLNSGEAVRPLEVTLGSDAPAPVREASSEDSPRRRRQLRRACRSPEERAQIKTTRVNGWF